MKEQIDDTDIQVVTDLISSEVHKILTAIGV